jgi:hypothetical protein
MDRRHDRRERSRAAIEAAIERLRAGKANHPRHVGRVVRLTKQAVAREARISSATLYRCPDLIARISEAGTGIGQRASREELRRNADRATIAELERRVNALMAEQSRLQELLAKYDPSLGERVPVRLDDRRGKRRA